MKNQILFTFVLRINISEPIFKPEKLLPGRKGGLMMLIH